MRLFIQKSNLFVSLVSYCKETMKRTVLVIAIGVLGFSAHAQQAVSAVNAASLTGTAAPVAEESLAVKETEFNFGKIPQGKPVTHIFEVSNTGKTAFKLDNVQASCGCTTPQWEKDKVIGSGEKDNITVGYNAAAEGPFTKSITITYNGTQTKVILIKGEVWKTPVTSAPVNSGLNDLKN